MTDRTTETADLPPPACRPTLARLQLVLDRELPAATLDSDQHAPECLACRERIAAARLLLAEMASPSRPAVPVGLTHAVLTAVREDSFARLRRRSYAVAAGTIAALAASVAVIVWLTGAPDRPGAETWNPTLPDQAREQSPPVAPEPRPLRLGDELSRAGQALLDTSRPIAEPAADAPRVFGALADSLAPPAAPDAGLWPGGSALAELPEAALAGLEPVASTTQKAFARLLRDVGGVRVPVKPKS
jgi:hypothetical protein